MLLNFTNTLTTILSVTTCVANCNTTWCAHPSIHPSIHCQLLIRGQVMQAAVSAGGPRLSSPWPHQPTLTEVSRDVTRPVQRLKSPPGPKSAPGPPPSWTWLKHLPREATGRHPYQMLKPPHLAPFNAKEQQLYSKFLTDDWTSYLIPKWDTSHPLFQPLVSLMSPSTQKYLIFFKLNMKVRKIERPFLTRYPHFDPHLIYPNPLFFIL